MRRIPIVLLTLLLAQTAGAKESKDQMKANYYYYHYAYNEAIPYLEKLCDTSAGADVFEKLGDCYRLTGNTELAARAYEQALAKNDHSDKAILNCGLMQMRLGKYEDAAAQFTAYQEKHPGDKRLVNLLQSCRQAAGKTKEEFPTGITQFAPFNSDGSDYAPTLWNRTLVFTSDSLFGTRKKTDKWSGNAYYGIYGVTLEGEDVFGEDVQPVEGPRNMNIVYHTGPCTFSSDGRKMYYTRSRFRSGFLQNKAVGGKDSSVTLEIVIASNYDTAARQFRDLTPFPFNSSNYSCAHPAISPDGRMLAFASDKPGGRGGRDLYICRAAGNGWTNPVNAGETVNTEGDEVFPWWADSATLYFSSDGHVGLGGLDIYRVTFDKETGTFGTPLGMPLPLNSSYDDMTLSLPAEGSGYFSSDRPAEKRGDNIYYYRRMNVYLALSVVDSLTGKKIQATVNSSSPKSSVVARVPADTLYTEHLWPNEHYSINVTKNGYWPRPFTLSAVSNGKRQRDTIYKLVRLAPKINTWDSTFAVTITESPKLPYRAGIMDTPAIKTFEVNKVYVIGYFDFNFNKFFYQANKSDINFEKKVVLDTLYNILKRHPTMVIEVQAHSDCRGSEEYNMKLSIDRAFSVVDYLRKRGIPKDRLEYRGFGETMPAVPCPDCYSCTEEEHAQNRVLELKVLKI